ncbi:glycoside hydrolase family 18 [Fusarium longipes]|uniref:Glycoside hydrolase family 18 n=1 Tax=Fusarium longipes TaxID=694270 RepID=A0A395SJP6_9HYPO|nr:glycoside hydrolase family 18 [Fusarium longipes]
MSPSPRTLSRFLLVAGSFVFALMLSLHFVFSGGHHKNGLSPRNTPPGSLDAPLICHGSQSLLDIDPSLQIDPDTGLPCDSTWRFLLDLLFSSSEKYKVYPPTGNYWNITFKAYPSGGQGKNLKRKNPFADDYGAEDPDDCDDTTISPSGNPKQSVVTEHIHERQTEARAQEFMMFGELELGDGQGKADSGYPVIDPYWLNESSWLFTPYNKWCKKESKTNISPIESITDAYGNTANSLPLVNFDSVLNGVKSRMWKGEDPISVTTWDTNNLWNLDNDHGGQAITVLNSVVMVINYLNIDEVSGSPDDPGVNGLWTKVVNAIIAEWKRYCDCVFDEYGVTLNADKIYGRYVSEVIVWRLTFRAKAFLKNKIEGLKSVWEEASDGTTKEEMIDRLEQLEEKVKDIDVNTEGMNLS